MPFYLSSYLGLGTVTDPFRPRGSQQPGWSAIDLRPNGGATLGGGGLNACLLHLPVADPDPLLRLLALDPADTIGPTLRQLLGTRLNLLTPLASGRWDDVAMELLLGPPPNGWKALRQTANGVFEVHLGGLLKRLPAISGGVAISENWNCANSASLTCQLTWTQVENADWNILANQADISGARAGLARQNPARADSDLATADHDVQVTLITWTIGSDGHTGVIARKDGTATLTFYLWIARWIPGPTKQWEMFKRVAGAFTSLGINAQVPVVNDVMRLRCNGSTITGFVNGISLVTITDTAITGNLRGGITAFSSVGTDVFDVDNWSAADLAAASVVTPRALALLGVGA